METKFTTSAQKTLSLSKAVILQRLEEEMTKEESLKFEVTNSEYMKAAKLPDGSKMVIAAFDKDNGKTLAMIDFKDLPNHKERSEIQNSLRQRLDDIFKINEVRLIAKNVGAAT